MNAHSMADVIVPKSDQINADDFIAGPRTITIRDVKITGGQEQPVSIFFDGSDKAYRPCKSMCRVLVQAWGPDAKAYVGRSLTLYRDPTVKWGGLEVGGIRISHMSDITGKMQMQLTATRGQRKPHVVLPLVMQAPAADAADRTKAEAFLAAYLANPVDTQGNRNGLARLQRSYPDLYAQTQKPPPADDWASGPEDSQTGAGNADRETADRLISDIRQQTDPTQLGFMADDLNAYMALPEALQHEVDAATEEQRQKLTVPA